MPGTLPAAAGRADHRPTTALVRMAVLLPARMTAGMRIGTICPQLRLGAHLPDIYACSTLVLDHRRRARTAARLLIAGAVLSGRSAAALWGVDLAGPGDDVECTVGTDCRAGGVRGVTATRRSLDTVDVVDRGGVRVTTPLRTALDLARIQPIEEAVVCLDRFLRAGLVTRAQVAEAAASLGGPGCRHVRRAVDLSDGLASADLRNP